jgi:hypothetical protein
MNGWQWYGTSELQLVPLMPGSPVYRDGMLSHLYYETRKEGKIEMVFCGDDLNHDQFIEFFQKRKTLQVLCKVEADKDLKPCGYCWVDSPVGVDGARSALCGFCFFSNGIEVCRDLGRLGLAYWFEDLRINTIHGILLESNIPGMNYALKLGFTDWGVVPDRHYHNGQLEGARVVFLRKNDFWPKFEEWIGPQKLVAEPL